MDGLSINSIIDHLIVLGDRIHACDQLLRSAVDELDIAFSYIPYDGQEHHQFATGSVYEAMNDLYMMLYELDDAIAAMSS